ncbi:hypothetical protein [Leuconostoc mesenteroides]|uniref:hypothetical protein n=1 Tax=Leuconostoc mesenteroides TaxID=1245 RepID=UPI000BBCE41A|nr:hypothetical protein [Leuconostoc mesenteroides]
MSNFFGFLWLIISVAFWVTIIILIVNRARKKETSFTWKTPLILFVVGVFCLFIGVITATSDSNSDKDTAASSSSSSQATKKSSSVDQSSLSSSKAKDSSEKAESISREASESSASSEEAASESAASASKAASESAASASKAASKASSEAAEKDPNSYNTGITYDQIARSPEDYKGKKMQFTGRVIQVMEDDDETEIRLAVDGNSDNIILVGFNPDILSGSRVLEDDLVTISGESVGTISYKSTMAGKITVPAIAANIINDQGKASDDYGY